MFTSTIASRHVTDKSPLSVTAPTTGFQTVVILFANVWKCITILLVQTLCSKQHHKGHRPLALMLQRLNWKFTVEESALSHKAQT